MFRKKYLIVTYLCALVLFFCLSIYLTYSINGKSEVITPTIYNIENIEHEIKIRALNLPEEYKIKHTLLIGFINNFYKKLSTINGQVLDFEQLWQEFDKEINEIQLFNSNNPKIGLVIQALKSAEILQADIYTRGTQLKFLFRLQGNHMAVFKPQWYDKNKIIIGNVYAGKDRFGSEILAFYLAIILNLRLVPIATKRVIDVKKEILPVASTILNTTKYYLNNKICIYGKCYYCKRDDPICTNDEGTITGAILFHIPGKIQTHNSPWQRTYKKGKIAEWETKVDYCSKIRIKVTNKRLLDLIDVAIFDFLIQNGDRHHYETLNNKVVLIDNGKGLGNPYVHHIDILAPLYQCCVLRHSTWERLKLLSGGTLYDLLKLFPEIQDVVAETHLKAIDERLQFIYAAVEYCRIRNKIYL